MKRIVRQATIFLGLLLLVSIVRLPYGSYRTSLLPRLKDIASRMQIRSLDAQDISLNFPLELSVTDLGMVIPIQGFPLPVFINNMNSSIGLLSLLRLQTNVNANGKLYSGTMNFVGSRSMFGRGGSTSFTLSDVKLESHPTLMALGARGLLSMEFEGTANDNLPSLKSVESAHLKFHLRDGEFSGPNPFIPLIKIPPISGIKLNAEAGLKGDRLTIHQANLESSMGSAQGSGSIVVSPNGQATSGTLDAQLQLTPEGTTVFGGYLALAANLPVDKPASNWRINVKITNGRAAVTFKPA